LGVRISLTGRVSIEANGARLGDRSFPGRQGRLVFAYLLSEEGRAVPRDELAEVLWGDAPPATWEKALSVLVSKLRALLEDCGVDGQAALRSAFGCYQLVLPPGAWFDLAAAREAAGRAAAALDVGDSGAAREAAVEAVALARRSFLPGEEGAWIEERRRELSELLVRALECLADACVAAGDAREAVRHAEELTTLEPYREGGYRRLMQAHAAAGDSAEALRVYERCRRLLADELGAYPSAETESIYRDLLQAPRSAAQAALPETGAAAAVRADERRVRAGPRGRSVVAVVGVVAVAAGAMAAALSLSGGSGAVVARANSLAIIDPQANRIVASVPVGARPSAVAVSEGVVWVANTGAGTVARIDPKTRRVVETIGIGAPVIDVAAADGAVWTANGREGTVTEINPQTNTIVQSIDLGGQDELVPDEAHAVAIGAGSLWVAKGARQIVRIDLKSGQIVATVDVGAQPSDVAVSGGSVWTATSAERVLRIEPRTNRVVARAAIDFPVSLAASPDAVWAGTYPTTVWRINPTTTTVTGTVRTGGAAAGIAISPTSVWVADGAWVLRLDPRTNAVERRIRLGVYAADVAADRNAVYVAAAPAT
jgi:DNA-binding SARP family transcriptional activator/DNA-binding beta-propeller fold protein YncE